MFVMAAPILCGAALVVGYVLIVVLTIPQLLPGRSPAWNNGCSISLQDAEKSDNGSSGDTSSPAGLSAVLWVGYSGPESDIYGLPLVGPSSIGAPGMTNLCWAASFTSPHYQSHTGNDFPVNEGTQVHRRLEARWSGLDRTGPGQSGGGGE